MYQLLIVDDQPDLVEDLASNLPWDTVGIETVYQANSGQEALEIMNTTPIDIVITDIHMPGLSGLDLMEQIRASWSNVKCILLSGYNDFEYAKKRCSIKQAIICLSLRTTRSCFEPSRRLRCNWRSTGRKSARIKAR